MKAYNQVHNRQLKPSIPRELPDSSHHLAIANQVYHARHEGWSSNPRCYSTTSIPVTRVQPSPYTVTHGPLFLPPVAHHQRSPAHSPNSPTIGVRTPPHPHESFYRHGCTMNGYPPYYVMHPYTPRTCTDIQSSAVRHHTHAYYHRVYSYSGSPLPSQPDLYKYSPRSIHNLTLPLPSHSLSPPLSQIQVSSQHRPSTSSRIYARRACVGCKKSHVACGAQRPCTRCCRLGKAHLCVDAERKKRGRPFGNKNTTSDQSKRQNSNSSD